jgi:hypothetical protein
MSKHTSDTRVGYSKVLVYDSELISVCSLYSLLSFVVCARLVHWARISLFALVKTSIESILTLKETLRSYSVRHTGDVVHLPGEQLDSIGLLFKLDRS